MIFKNVLPGVVVVVVAIIVENIASFIKVSILDSYSGFRTVRLCMYFVRLSFKIFPNHRCTFTDFFWLNCFFLRFLPFPAVFKLNLFLTKFFVKMATFTFYVGIFFNLGQDSKCLSWPWGHLETFSKMCFEQKMRSTAEKNWFHFCCRASRQFGSVRLPVEGVH